MTTSAFSIGRAIVPLILLLSLVPIAQTASAAPAAIPGFATPDKNAAVAVLLAGPAGELPTAPWLVIEQLDLADGDTLPALSTTQIVVNESGELSLVDDLGLEASLPEGEGIHVPAGEMGDLTAASDTTILRISLVAGEPKNDALIAAELPDDAPDPADLWFARVTLPAGASLGDAISVGPTAIVALDADLAVDRPGRLPATLPAEKGILLPTGTELEVRNDGKTEAVVLLAGLAPADQDAASATTSSTPRATPTPEPRGSTRDSTPTPTRRASATRTPTRRATATPRPSGSATQVAGRLGGTRSEWENREGSYYDTSITDYGETMYYYIPAVGDSLWVTYQNNRVQEVGVIDNSVYSDADSASLINQVIARHAPSDAICDFDGFSVVGEFAVVDCSSAGLARTVGDGAFTVWLLFDGSTVGIILDLED